MYDPKTEPREFVGQTRDEAVAKAMSFFEAAQEELAISDVDPKRVHGTASRAVVVAVPRGQRGGAPERSRERGRQGVREPARERPRERGRQGAREPARERPRERVRPQEAAPAEEAAEPSVGRPKTDLSELGEFVRGLIERMGLGPFEIAESIEGNHRILELRGPATSGLTGGEARAVDAIQLLANQAAMRRDDERRVILDVEGDLARRQGLLERVAERAARRAQSSGRAVALDPMDSRDRRVVHLALREFERVATMSVGEGRYRQVVVVPEGAPEYEEASRYEASALQGREE